MCWQNTFFYLLCCVCSCTLTHSTHTFNGFNQKQSIKSQSPLHWIYFLLFPSCFCPALALNLLVKLSTFLIFISWFETDFASFSFLFCPPVSTCVPASQLLLHAAEKISAKSFYQTKTEESNSSQMSCQITTSRNEGVNLRSVMKDFEDMFSLDFSPPVLHPGMQVNMQARQRSSRSSCVREGHKINMAVGPGCFLWSDDSEWNTIYVWSCHKLHLSHTVILMHHWWSKSTVWI